MKKILLLLMALGTFLTGCEKKQMDDKVQTISYSIWAMEQEPAVKELVSRFEKQNPDIKVKLEVTPWGQYWTKLEASATGGVAPDVFSMGQEVQIKYAKSGLVEPLNKYIEKDNISLDNYANSVVKAYKLDGIQYAMPRDIDSIGLAFNKKIFDEAGVAYPTNDWTWEDMIKASTKIKKSLKGIYPVAFEMDGQNSYYNIIPQAGGFVINDDMTKSGYDDPKSIDGIKMISNLIKDGLMPSAEELSDMDTVSLFQSNKVAMFYAGSWNVQSFVTNKELEGQIGFVRMPLIKKRIAVSNGIGLMMSAKSKNKDAAWKLIKFLTSEESQSYLATSGTVIPALKKAEPLWSESFKNIDTSGFIKQLSYAYSLPTSKDAAKWRDVEEDLFKKVWAGRISPEEASLELAQKMNQALKDEQL